MTQQISLTVRGEQVYGGERTRTEQRLSGTMERTEDGYLLRYAERGEDDALTENVLALTPERITLTRTGAVNTRFIFEQGRAHSARYALSFGALPVTVEAEHLAWKRTARGLLAEVRYRIDLAGEQGLCRLKLQAQALTSEA